MPKTTDDLMKNRACDYGPCVAVAVPGQLFCIVHTRIVDARRERDGHRTRRRPRRRPGSRKAR